MADVDQVITLGIGTPSDLAHFVLVGLSPSTAPPVVLAEGPHARTGESGWSGGTFSDPAQGFGWGWD